MLGWQQNTIHENNGHNEKEMRRTMQQRGMQTQRQKPELLEDQGQSMRLL